jgi:hypothetical protein
VGLLTYEAVPLLGTLKYLVVCRNHGDLGPMLWFFKFFRRKFQRKNWRFFFTQNKAKLCRILIITLVFEKNANFFAENCQKSPKIVIITSTPGCANFSPGVIVYFGHLLEVKKWPIFLRYFFQSILTKVRLFIKNSSGHPGTYVPKNNWMSKIMLTNFFYILFRNLLFKKYWILKCRDHIWRYYATPLLFRRKRFLLWKFFA